MNPSADGNGAETLIRTLVAGGGKGVPGIFVTSLDAFGKTLKEGLASEGPTLIEISL